MQTPEHEKDRQDPIKLSASRIRTSVSQFVTQELHDAFPRNYVYMRGDYNRVFVVVEGYGDQCHGFFEKGYLITLDPDGQFRSGEVIQHVGDSTHSWKFYEAKLTEASDIEVVRYAPLLMASLFNQIEKELKEGKVFGLDNQKRGKWQGVLQRREGKIVGTRLTCSIIWDFECQARRPVTGLEGSRPTSSAQDKLDFYSSLIYKDCQCL